ncbi:hypothetical protein [Epilithonimonas sp. UC225_85]|uniref:hypothetical protein n=1 Tax=Epilithonimonas sp. UC225_85 TaxID=3350167 RepID=UPI0036D2E80A
MKFWSIITLTIFLNFTALPGIAAMFGWELPRTNVIVNEEEQHSSAFFTFEKTIPKTLDIYDYLKFCESVPEKKTTPNWEANIYFSPYLTIFSPPPEA